MRQNIIARGAEAIIIKQEDKIIKQRIKKSYRLEQLDERLRKSRTKKESNILEKAVKIINAPHIFNQDNFTITMEFIEGEKLSDSLNNYPIKKQELIMKMIAEQVSKLHGNNIIHGDLTTSNMILKENKIYIIDFGLGFISQRIEDKAVDLHLIKQALEAKHFQNHEELFKSFLASYKHKEVIERLKKVEARGRYKH
ncbi:MAG: KEOPS complex kinase/ATPase Bud32 [Nanoarchaeota archaeon]